MSRIRNALAGILITAAGIAAGIVLGGLVLYIILRGMGA
jgi:hypothetical protein